MSGVDNIHRSLAKLLPIYEMIRDVIAGPSAVKSKGVKYLPNPDPTDATEYGVARYDAYLDRAIFFEATGRTHEGFVGQVFYRETQIELPASLEFMRQDVDGQGIGLEQQAKNTVGEDLALGRAGLYTDYSTKVGEKPTLADQQAGRVRPVISMHLAENIINWRHTVMNNLRILSLVVLRETYCEDDDGFSAEEKTQFRELRLENLDGKPVFITRVWRDGKVFLEAVPTRGDGTTWDRIPFEFIGARDNDPDPDKPPLEGMAHVNIGHYRNSADYEEMIFISGQPTPYATNITDMWMKEHWNGELHLGSREFVALPVNSTMGMLQMETNTLAKQAMDQKENQLVALGAKIVENKAVSTTATEENRDSVMENSVLSSVAKNVSQAYTRSLIHACTYANVDPDVVFEINTDFELTRMSAQDRAQLLGELQGGGITWEEYRWNIKRGGIAYQDDAEAKAIIDAELAASIDLAPKPKAPENED